VLLARTWKRLADLMPGTFAVATSVALGGNIGL
jgi:hypothetical protein